MEYISLKSRLNVDENKTFSKGKAHFTWFNFWEYDSRRKK